MAKEELTVVGIGASAGGLEALQTFVQNLPTKTNITYILAQHLSPTYKSMMVDLLQKDATIHIKEAQNQELIEADTLYICPPNKNIIIEGERIIIMEAKQLTYGPKPSINILFESIAANKGSRAIGIIVSGTGSDGSAGIRAIKAEGGFTIVQQPQSAKYDGMPNSAINTGNVDLILDVELMGKEIVELLKYPNRRESLNNIDSKTKLYKSILDKLKRNKKTDFSLYKTSTIQRRIERRMAAMRLTSLEEYYNYLVKTNSEVDELFKDILIGVTSFFRDEEAFIALKQQLTNMIEKKETSSIRIWIPGCSTGEEVYTIAMVLSEVLGDNVVNYKIQIFATDIDDRATKFARAARYPESSLMNVEKHYVKKYFIIKNDEYEVIKPIRDMCIFSRHDITNDPAFMRLDMISCRNLLIYFTTELQQKIFPMFHYSLNDEAILFLGKSESIGNFNHQFKIVDKRWKIYRALYLGQKSAPVPMRTFEPKDMENYDNTSSKVATYKPPSIADMMVEHIQRHIIPLCVVVNDSLDMIYIRGKNPFLKRPDGEISQNIFKNVLDDLSVELRANFHISKKESRVVKTQFQKVFIDKAPRFVRLIISPLENSLTSNLYMVCFQEESIENLESFRTSTKNLDSKEELEKLEFELTRTKEHLQTVIEELETSNEEMQSLNEELQSSNEELQSSNEELETTNEELQSTNEELQTAYTEMRAMFEERDGDAREMNRIKKDIEIVNQKLSAVLDASHVGIFDIDLSADDHIYVNERWAEILGFTLEEIADKNNLFKWFEKRVHKNERANVEKHFEKLISGKIESYKEEFRIQDKNDQYIWVEYFATVVQDIQSHKITNIVGTLKDIHEEKAFAVHKEILQSKFSDAVEMAKLGAWEWNIETNSIWWSNLMYDIFEMPQNTEINFATVTSAIVESDKEKHAQHIEASLKDGTEHNITFNIKTKSGIKNIWAKGKIILDENNNPSKMVGLAQDITHNHVKEMQLDIKEQYIQSILHSSFNGVYIYSFTNNTNTYINPQYTNITGYTLEDLQAFNSEQFAQLFHEDEVEAVFAHIQEVKNSQPGTSFEITYRFRHKDGHFITILSRDSIVANKLADEAIEMIGTFKEIGQGN